MTDSCKTCKFYKQNGKWVNKANGVCRRFPPVRAGSSTMIADPGTYWPEVQDHEWCGEFKFDTKKA